MTFVNIQDQLEYTAYLLSRRKVLTTPSAEVAAEIKAIDRELDEIKPLLQGEAGLHGTIESDHLLVAYRAGTTKVDIKQVQFATALLVEVMGRRKDLVNIASLLHSAISVSDASGTVTLKRQMSEFEIAAWKKDLQGESKGA